MTEETERDDYRLEELLEDFRQALEDELHVAVSGRIDSYDVATQKAVVTPTVRRTLSREDGTTTTELLPPIRNVPVIVLRGGGFFGPHFPLTAGDFALLIIAERDLSRFLQTGEISVAPDSRLHHLAHAIALPGLFPNGSAIGSLPTDALELGNVGAGPRIKITSSVVEVGGTKALAEHPDLEVHLDQISIALDAVAARIAVLDFGVVIDATYGVLAKAVLDGTNPIATTITKGD